MLQNCYVVISELRRSYLPTRGGRRRCEDYPAIDIRHPYHHDLIDQPGSCISWRWNRNGEPLCYIDVVFNYDRIAVTNVTDRNRPHTVSIFLLRTPCHYGGSRAWLSCPGCGRRRAKLHFCNGNVSCRDCHGLAYKSQLEASADRPRLIAQRIRRILGGSSNLALPFPPKPAKMSWQNYERIRAKGEKFEERAVAGLADWFEKHRSR